MLTFHTLTEAVVFWLLVTSFLVQVLFYLFLYSRLAFYRKKVSGTRPLPVSVVICARNELPNLQKNIGAILEQEGNGCEVVLVNDCSWDETENFLKELASQHKHLKVVSIKEQEKYKHGKKFALTLGIKAATHEHLLLTDADCIPAGREWLKSMQNNFTDKKEIVLGYGAVAKGKGLLNRLVRADVFMIALRYFSFALAGMPYMGTGRNLAYSKSLFFRNKGFANHNHIASGDDDLFVNETATENNVAIEVHKSSFTFTSAPKNFRAWLKQKSRHLSTSPHYRALHKLFLGTDAVSSFVFYVSLILWLALGFDWRVAVALFSFRFLVQLIINIKAMLKLGEKDLIILFPFIEPILVFLSPVFFLSSKQKQTSWK
jgi:cellulose synthase/poly-beta-1,6-N-acetylglucosamine synthase-like glycosyltransferase